MSSPSFIEFGRPPFPRSDTLSQSGPLKLCLTLKVDLSLACFAESLAQREGNVMRLMTRKSARLSYHGCGLSFSSLITQQCSEEKLCKCLLSIDG